MRDNLKAIIEEAHNSLMDSIETVNGLYKAKLVYPEWLEAQHRVDEYVQYYKETINGMFVLGVINKEEFDYSYSLLDMTKVTVAF